MQGTGVTASTDAEPRIGDLDQLADQLLDRAYSGDHPDRAVVPLSLVA